MRCLEADMKPTRKQQTVCEEQMQSLSQRASHVCLSVQTVDCLNMH